MRIEIRSLNNFRLKAIQKQKKDHFFFEGEKLVEDIIRRKLKVDKLICSDSWEKEKLLHEESIDEIWVVSDSILKKISGLNSNPHVIAVIHRISQKIDWSNHRCVVVLDSIQDPGNVGAIFRCAAAFGIRAIILTGSTAQPQNLKVIRSAQTALFNVSFERYPLLNAVLPLAETNNFYIYFTTPHPTFPPISLPEIRFPALLVFGNEGRGIDRKILHRFPSISIPQEKDIESLNVAITAGIVFHHLYTASI